MVFPVQKGIEPIITHDLSLSQLTNRSPPQIEKLKLQCMHSPKGSWSEQRECQIEVTGVGGGVGGVGCEVDGAAVDVGTAADVGDDGEEVVHHTGVELRRVRPHVSRPLVPGNDSSLVKEAR